MNPVALRAAEARRAARALAAVDGATRDRALLAIARSLDEQGPQIEEANIRDLEEGARNDLAPPLVKRLRFDTEKRSESARGVRSVAALADPVGTVLEKRELDTGLILSRVSTPIGVIGMIFESRPDALVQIAALALKSGNAVVLKGGSEARESNRVLFQLIRDASLAEGIPEGWIQLIETREDVRNLLALDREIDLLIPRGSNEFVRYIMDNTRIPVMGHADGICHVYVHADADPGMVGPIVVDSKTQYVAVCNAAETLLIHREAAAGILPDLVRDLQKNGVEVRGCQTTCRIVPSAAAATDEDWSTEYLDYIISVRVVDSLEQAVEHINRYGSGHTDAILTASSESAQQFIRSVDSASVMWNASTRFADGFRYGLGAEVGISTSRIHARGPVGVAGLLSYKWILAGNGQVVADYGPGGRTFTHREL